VIGRYYDRHYRWWGEPGWRPPYRPWRVGYAFPRHLHYYPVPYDLYRRLPPPPYGCRYVRYGDDILLISLATLLVIDAIILVDAYDGYDDGYYYYDDDYYYDDYY
jgi:Ni/Co efflux regulator RcnB